MQIYDFFAFFVGSCRYRINGRSDKLLNLLELNDIGYTHLLTDDDGITLTLDLVKAKELTHILDEKSIDYTLISERGLPFLIKRLIKRPGIILGAVFFAFVMTFYGKFVFDIKISGSEHLSDRYVLDALSSFGFRVGSYIPDVDFDALSVAIPGKYGDISWIFVNMMGNVAMVDVREYEKDAGSEKPHDDGIPCDIVATKAGQICSFEVSEGIVKVSLGETVYEGQILVSGIEKTENGETAFRSSGKVFAKTVRFYTLTQNAIVSEKKYSERKLVERSLIFLGKEIKVFKKDRQQDVKCDIIEEEYKLMAPLSRELPVIVRDVYALPYTEEERELDDDEGHEVLDDRFAELTDTFGDDVTVLGIQTKERKQNGVFIRSVRLYCIENIGSVIPAVRENENDGKDG